MFKPILAAAAMSAALATTPAIADEAQGNTATVAYDDLNLATEKGQKVLKQRLERAAREVCEANSVRTGTRVPSNEKRQCLDMARKSAKAQFAQLVSEQQLGG